MRRILELGLVAVMCCMGVARGDDDPRRPPAIETQEVPRVPPEVFARLGQYQNTRSAAFTSFSPDGKGILIATRFGNSVQLHRLYEPGGRREQITFFEEPVNGRFIPQAKDGAVLLSISRGGDENDQLYLLDRAAYRTTLLTDGKSKHNLGPVLRDGSKMIVASNRRNGRDTDLYVAECRQPGSMQPLLETDGEFWTPQDWSQDGKKLLLIHYVSINETYPAILDVATRTKEPLPIPRHASEKTAVGDLAFSPDGRTVYFTSDAQGEFLQLGRLDLASGKIQWLSGDIPWDVRGVVVEPKSGRVAFLTNEDGASRLYLLEDNKPRSLDVPLGVIANLEFSPDGQQLGFTLARADAPAEAYSVSLADGRLSRWTYSETGGLDPSTFIAPTRISYSTFDGRQTPAYYFKPRTATPASPAGVVISIHGGPESQYRPYFWPTEQYYLNELGLAVIHPNVRGSAGYGKTYLQLDNAALREDSVRDIGALLDWVARQPELDAQRVAVTGGSYGGYMVLASLVHHGDRLRAGIDHVGIANFITFLERTSPYRQDLRRAEYGDERDPAMRAVFERISPLASAAKIRSALMLVHGRNDPRVPFSEALQIAAKVRAAGRPVWTVFADNEGHGFSKKDNRDYATGVEVMFLKQHLGLGVMPASAGN
jgi:dipeptidyl aminopeptidase/acylaminoacyl peptidase